MKLFANVKISSISCLHNNKVTLSGKFNVAPCRDPEGKLPTPLPVWNVLLVIKIVDRLFGPI
jgi:hypothetical protein